MPTRTTTRSGRVVKNSSTAQSKLDALELLERKRKGEKVDIGIKEDAPLFDEVIEEEYKRTKKAGFIVDRESDDDYDSEMEDFIDEGDDYDDNEGQSSSKKSGKRKRKEDEVDPKQRSMRSFLGNSSKSHSKVNKPLTSSDKHAKEPENQDDILTQMLFDVPKSRQTSTQKPLKLRSSSTTSSTPHMQQQNTPSRLLKTKSLLESSSLIKRARLSSPDHNHKTQENPFDELATGDWPASGSGGADDEFDDSFTDPPAKFNHKLDDVTNQNNDDIGADCELEDDESTNDVGIKAIPLNEDLKSNLKFEDYDDGQKKFTKFYWYDCCEDQNKSPGVVYFFGRVLVKSSNNYVSCCTIVKNVMKTCYLLITEDSTYDQALGEFTHIIAKKYKIKNFTCSEVTKKYAFSDPKDNIPLVSKYVRVDYPVSQQATLPTDLKGETFSKVLNLNQTPMEKIILDLKLRGPCWLKLIDPVAPTSQLTWSRIELVLESPENLIVEDCATVLKAPYFCAFSLSLRTYPNPVTHQNEIIAIAGMVNKAFNLDQCLKSSNKASGHFMIMTKPSPAHKELKLPYDFNSMIKKYKKTIFQVVDSERDLLTTFMDKFDNLDPDIVIGHDLLNFDYETLVGRMKSLKVGVWSKLGRFKRTELPCSKSAFRYMFSGRPICDIRTSAMELIHARSYDLTELVSQVLKSTRVDYNHTATVEAYKSSDSLIKLLNATWDDNNFIFSILVELNVIPLALKITNITGNILSRTLAAGRSERNEYLLLHAFHEEGFICPEKQLQKFKSFKQSKQVTSNTGEANQQQVPELAPTRKKAAYSGGLVLEPKTGYYDTCILLMDFNSLYPSIIQEFNICFSTVKIPELPSGKSSSEADLNIELIATVPEDDVATGVLPTQLRNLVNGRRRVKKLLAEAKTPDEKMMLDIEQKALKLTANSMYGCLGFEQSRFYAKHLASLVTFKGREILLNTKSMVESMGYEVIYGDTDSLMINTKIIDYDEVILKGNAIKADINKTFKLLEIDIDGVYRPLLLLKKKNYAGSTIKRSPNDDKTFIKEIETKGLDTVRRDRAVIAKEAGEYVLKLILACEKDINETVEDIHNYLKQLGDNVRSNQIDKTKFLISKQLNRNPEEYRDTKGIGHVTLALRYNKDTKRSKKLKAGDTVEYVICCDNTNESANQRAYSLEELNEDPERLKIDYEYYLCQQIHPVMTRICDKLPTTNAYTLAEMLGIEKSNMLHIKRDDTDTIRRDQLISKGESRFNTCRPLIITCPNCNLPDEIKSRTRKNKEKKLQLSLSNCQECGFRYALKDKVIIIQIMNIIKKLMLELFNTKYVCENAECYNETRNVFGHLTCNSNNTDNMNNFPGTSTASSTAGAATTKTQLICDLCDSPMQPEMDDYKLDLQLGFYKYLFDISREKENSQLFATNSISVGKQVDGVNSQAIVSSNNNNLNNFAQDMVEMYEKCYKEVDYALRCSYINNIDAYSMFSMICSGRTLEQADKLLPY